HYQENPYDCNVPSKGYSLFLLIMPFTEESNVFNAVNFALPTGYTPTNISYPVSVDVKDTQATALLTTIQSYICPSDLPLVSQTSGSGNHYSQCSYAGMVGTRDIWHWWYGCPGAPSPDIQPDGVFGGGFVCKVSGVTDG